MRAAFASLTARLVVTAVALVAVVALVIGAAATVALRSYLSGRLDDDVTSSLDRMTSGPRALGVPDGGPADHGFDGGQRPGSLQAAATRANYFGFVVTRSDSRTLTQAQVEQLAQVTADGRPHDVSISGLGEYRVAVARRQVSFDSGLTAAPGVVVAGLPTSTVDGPVSQLVAWEVVFGLIGVAAAAGAGTYVVRRQLRPLREVASTAHTVAALPLAAEVAIAPRVPAHLTDERTEVGQVGSALNSLLVHVESSLAQRHRSEQQVRQFVADASHELRTPLTTIAGYTELARRRPGDSDAANTALAKVEEESARMTSMVEDLLLLARLDAGRPLARETVDLTRLLVEAVSDARVVAPDHQWRLELPEESVEVAGDSERLHQVVTNLLTNARKHTPPGTTVTVTGTAYGFSVHDDGPGFPPALAGTAFERFVRGDASRSRSGSGAGLGLALVDAIVSAHRGSVRLDSRPGSTTVSVGLPG